jgi:hypothetical protein
MMLAREIFDPETNKRVLVDHAFVCRGRRAHKGGAQLDRQRPRRIETQSDHVRGSGGGSGLSVLTSRTDINIADPRRTNVDLDERADSLPPVPSQIGRAWIGTPKAGVAGSIPAGGTKVRGGLVASDLSGVWDAGKWDEGASGLRCEPTS